MRAEVIGLLFRTVLLALSVVGYATLGFWYYGPLSLSAALIPWGLMLFGMIAILVSED